MRLAAVDPGVHACGVAVFRDGTLEAAAYVEKPPGAVSLARAVAMWVGETPDRVVVEKPQIYVGRLLKGDPNDLVDVALVAGGVIEALGGVGEVVFPREWKGQIPKPKTGEEYIVEARARKKLSPEELDRVRLQRARSLSHNVWDAVGLGLWRLGRH